MWNRDIPLKHVAWIVPLGALVLIAITVPFLPSPAPAAKVVHVSKAEQDKIEAAAMARRKAELAEIARREEIESKKAERILFEAQMKRAREEAREGVQR